MWFTVVTARRFIFLSFQPRLAAALLRSGSVVNNPTRRAGLIGSRPKETASVRIQINPRLDGLNRDKLGNTVARLSASIPNQVARVAKY